MGPSCHLRPARLAILAGVAAVLVAVTGCSGGDKANQAAKADGPPAVLVAGLDDLAQKAGCQLKSQTKAQQLRQGACQDSKGRYTLLTFTSENDQKTWLEEAKNWGGSYLVGPRWVAVAEDSILQNLRRNLGGEIQHGRRH